MNATFLLCNKPTIMNCTLQGRATARVPVSCGKTLQAAAAAAAGDVHLIDYLGENLPVARKVEKL